VWEGLEVEAGDNAEIVATAAESEEEVRVCDIVGVYD